ncbi:MAG: TetR/AcrR family transcriptional regulator [Halothiobacillaceae bacterium]|nr:TetR/AcrR family transcriptional regulator [Halothiobacillaceae bacterium]
MSAESKNATPRSDARRAQILTAASDCFRIYGFHGASIARISEASGMSAGHIYHYFENKEAIIEAIVSQDSEHLMAFFDELHSEQDVLQALLECAAHGVEEKLDVRCAGLQLEIMSEAARNPRIAAVVQEADHGSLSCLVELLGDLRRKAGYEDSEAAIRGMAGMMAIMFEGLYFRAICNPRIEKETIIPMFRRALQDLLNQPSM